MSKINFTSVRYDKAVAQDSLNKCRDHRSKLRDEVDYLQRDIDAYKRRLERAYRPRVPIRNKGPEIEDLGTFKLYPRGVTHRPTWAYGDEKVVSNYTPVDVCRNPVVSKTIFASDGSVRHIYTVASEVNYNY